MSNSTATESGTVSAGIFQGVAYDAGKPLPLGGGLIVLGLFLGTCLVFHCIMFYLNSVPSFGLVYYVFFDNSISGIGWFRPLAALSVVYCIILLAAVIGEAYLLFLFFLRRKSFPGFFRKFFLWIALADIAVAMSLFLMTSRLDWVSVACPVAALLLWSSYLHKSERVKGTFLRS